MEEPATQDIRGVYVVTWLLRAMGQPDRPASATRGAAARLAPRRGAHRRDLDKDGRYDDDAAVTLMDAWWPELVKAQFGPALGGEATGELPTSAATTPARPGQGAAAPAFSDGW